MMILMKKWNDDFINFPGTLPLIFSLETVGDIHDNMIVICHANKIDNEAWLHDEIST